MPERLQGAFDRKIAYNIKPVRYPSVNTYFAGRDISVFSEGFQLNLPQIFIM